jgi:hypothetical protein
MLFLYSASVMISSSFKSSPGIRILRFAIIVLSCSRGINLTIFS